MKEPALVILTIIMILFMTATALLAVILAANKKTKANIGIRNISLLLLCYLLAAFLQYYFQRNAYGSNLIKTLGILSDICYFLFIVNWIYVIAEFSQNSQISNKKIIASVTAIYGILTELIVVFAGSFTSGGIIFSAQNTIWKYILLWANALYALWILYIAAKYIIYCLKRMEKGINRTIALMFSICLAFYMVWTLFSDYENVYMPQSGLSGIIVIDPLLIIYCVVSAATIYFFFKKDPLELFSEEHKDTCKEQLPDFISQYGLTKREAEVLELICQGLNNPDIAEKLYISEYTVKRHINNIFHKTEAKNRYELISKVLKK